MPLGVDIVEPPMQAALEAEGITVRDGQQIMLDAREIKSVDEIMLLNIACSMVDGAYQLISEQLRPGIRENELVADVTKFLFDLGSEHVDNINAVSGERCSPHPHVFSDRIIRPGDQAFFDIIHTFMGYKTCYYRTFVVGKANDAQRDAYKQAREWIDRSIELMRPGVTTDQVAKVWPKAEEFGFDSEMECFGLQFGHSVGLFLHERPIISRLNSLEHPVELKEGMVIALETYCPAKDGVSAARIEEEVVITADGPQRHHPLPVRRAVRRERVLGAGRWRRPTPEIARETRLRMYRTMVECRYFEVRAQELFFEGLVRGTSHLGIGQEAIAAGFGAAMRADDYTFCTYRGHNHTLVRGVAMAAILAELIGRGAGLMGGKGGSMHLTSVEHDMMGSYAIIGAHLPIANGAAWSAQYRGTGQVAVCFFGDGTTNIGAFHEALNFAVIWKVPVVFVCENNLYMEYTSIRDVTAVEHPAADRARAYGLEPIVIDGNDVDAVYRMAQRALERARAGGGPRLIEAETYRHGGHSRADPGKYRPDEEVAELAGARSAPALSRALLEVRRRRRRARGDRGRDPRGRRVGRGGSARRARAAADVLETKVWADGGSAWRN